LKTLPSKQLITAYLAGPDVFLPDAAAHAARKIAIAARHGITGLAPLDDAAAASMSDLNAAAASMSDLNAAAASMSDLNATAASMTDDEAWRAIFHKDIAMMEASDIIIANLTPFRGASADAGTLVELGWFLGRGKPVFGYSNCATPFDNRSRAHAAQISDATPGLMHESFGLPDNLMVVGAVLLGGPCPFVLPQHGHDQPFDALKTFEHCIALAAHAMAGKRGDGQRLGRIT
jgi:nucleoside 2-deoxyribosyltransferase